MFGKEEMKLNKIKYYRKKNDLTQTQLGLKVGMNQSQICKIENNERSLKANEISLFAKTLKVEMTDILEEN